MRRLTEGEESDDSVFQCHNVTAEDRRNQNTRPPPLRARNGGHNDRRAELHKGLKGFCLKGTEVQKVERKVNREWMTHLEPLGK